MICDSCKKEKLVTDFIKNQKYCYQCEYRKKKEKTPKNRTENLKKCRLCGKQISHDKNLKKRQRSVFCSSECAHKGHKDLRNNYWTRKLNLNWKLPGEGKWSINQK